MMTIARRHQVDTTITPYYHCVSRCVRRSFLCGVDAVSGKNFEHRRQWVENRILYLAEVYCIDICAYAVMSNHYHLVVHINEAKAAELSGVEVIERWGKHHHLHPLAQRYLNGEIATKSENVAANKLIEEWRKRLASLSWMMKELNMAIAKQANTEDECTGHFWEGRFKSQALLDEKALLAAMTYVDLNPVRANAAPTPEESEHTSLKLRLSALENQQSTPFHLFPFVGGERLDRKDGIPFRLMDYIEWVDWVGKHHYSEGRYSVDQTLPPLLARLSDNQREFLELCTCIEQRRCLWVGPKEQLLQAKQQLNKQRIHGVVC